MYETFIDLDELIVLCRDKHAKKLIQEAVACYRAGAFRSCIVATWNAVVFDFLHKLRELELLGNGEASTRLQDFDNLRIQENVKELWQFESNIPEVALNEFELISSIEQEDIRRLLKDRSRCAHPSMTSLEEPFEATAELARYHLRSAVIHLLQRPPVQGRSALNRIWNDIKSENFPPDIESAVIVLQKSPLARARFTVIKDIILGLTISLLKDELPDDERKRQFSALNAVSKMYPKEAGEILSDKLSDIILNKIVDANWDKVIIYLGSVTAWERLSEPCQIKARVFINKLDVYDNTKFVRFPSKKLLIFDNIDILVKAAYVDFLRDSVINKLQITFDDLLKIKNHYKDTLLNEKVIHPLLRVAIHEATLDNLAAIISDVDTNLYDLVENPIKVKIEKASFDDLLQIISEYSNEKLYELIKPYMRDKISNAPLQSLLLASSDFKSELIELDRQLIELTDVYLVEKIQQISFDNLNELIKIRFSYEYPIINQHFKNLLVNNIADVVDKFINSNSYANAKSNAYLLVEVSEYLTSEQSESILEAFCENDQIYDSFGCPDIFISLFNKSKEMSGVVQPYWLHFRQNLDKLPKDKGLNQLKRAIDSTQCYNCL